MNILVPTDFSEVSESAADYAAEFALALGKTKTRLIFSHVFTMPVPVSDIPVVTVPLEDMEKEAMKLLRALHKRITTRHGAIETELKTNPGFAVDEISSIIKSHKIDLLIMGVTGAGKAPDMYGSNATSVISRATCPVIIVPKGHKFKKPSTVALACDYKSIVPDETVEKFKSFVHLFNSKVLVFNVLKPTELATYEKAAAEVNLENALGNVKYSLHFQVSENLVQEINAFVDEHKVEILAMFPHNYSFFKGLVHHSATKEMAFSTHIPLLSIHE